MYTLYIDTHGEILVMALLRDGKLLSSKEIKSEKHTENAVKILDLILRENDIAISNIDLVIVINGPGSFTGVRIGIVIAKTLGFTMSKKVKALTYLEAMAINYNEDVVVGIKDRNGVYIGEFNKKHELKTDYFYLNNKDYENYNKEIIFDSKINLENIYKYMENKKEVNPHLLNPLYVKKLGMIP